MSDQTLHKAHYDMSLNLLETIFAALKENLQRKDSLTLQDLEESFGRIRAYWPNLMPLYVATCKECSALNVKVYAPDARRKDFVTRLVFSRILNRVPKRPVGTNGQFYPNLLAPGIQANIKTMLSPSEFQVYNQLARNIFAETGTDRDDEIWPIIDKSEPMSVMTNRILVKLLTSFRSFNTRHWEFLRILQQTVDPTICKVDDTVFCELFESLFQDFAILLAREEGRLRFDMIYGESSAEQLTGVLMTYQRYRQGIEPTAVKSAQKATGTGRR